MNQIPNIEETHSTREVEEKLETYFPADLRMRAYYYGFKPTRVRDIDKVLSAVAIAGKAFHSTDQWVDEMYEEGVTAEKLIQYAADAAAVNIHHQLQKARGEMLHKLHLCAIGKYEGDALENVKAQIKEFQDEL